MLPQTSINVLLTLQQTTPLIFLLRNSNDVKFRIATNLASTLSETHRNRLLHAPNANSLSVPSTSSILCPSCCLWSSPSHRHPISHACAVQEEAPPQKNDAARALLAKNFPASSSKKPAQRVTKIPSNPVKLAQYRKVELMKMRHRAVPGDPKDKTSSTPLDQRLHIRLKVDPTTEKVLWFRKVCGRISILSDPLKES